MDGSENEGQAGVKLTNQQARSQNRRATTCQRLQPSSSTISFMGENTTSFPSNFASFNQKAFLTKQDLFKTSPKLIFPQHKATNSFPHSSPTSHHEWQTTHKSPSPESSPTRTHLSHTLLLARAKMAFGTQNRNVQMTTGPDVAEISTNVSILK
jgi:hypothetical protein